ncbi:MULTISPECIES: RNA polymerase sigma factor [unclassified Arenibacter]|uniref:RNA polymerase sigma factor n=1 Tax=unclassified Arenibacter TaxID=2615047 RepID=UPI000E341171|nr:MULTISPECIES: RNA polymerase sigma-70 factor [unclassified Arenibacter]MCM4164574.1 RNA polymerase sigma-70 factor [Arenibacter sp. A80]RFT55658.1 RNA polymerase sigma-70 factor [Arenibacter sp. P308M17]
MINKYLDNSKFIEALKLGDSKAYTALVDIYHHKLCIYAYSLTNDHNAAEDIVQNVFIRTWKKRGQLKCDFEIRSFLYKSVHNEFIDEYRKKKLVVPLEKKYIDALTNMVENEDEYALDQKINLIKREIQNLPPKCQEIFILSKQEGLTNLEISEYMQVSIKSVEAHITKAFNILRKSIGDKVNIVMLLFFKTRKGNLRPIG